MFKKTSTSEQFMGKTGDFSTRISARGYGESSDTMEVLTSLKEQYDALKVRLRAETDNAERSNLIRQIGDMRLILEEGARFSFETIFVRVAQARLPANVFLLFVEEARTYWRREGFAALAPPPTRRQLRKNAKREARRASQSD
jgi:hypothetical protein